MANRIILFWLCLLFVISKGANAQIHSTPVVDSLWISTLEQFSGNEERSQQVHDHVRVLFAPGRADDLDALLEKCNAYGERNNRPEWVGLCFQGLAYQLFSSSEFSLSDSLLKASIDNYQLSPGFEILNTIIYQYRTELERVGCTVELSPLSPTSLPVPVIDQVFQTLLTNVIRHAYIPGKPLILSIEGAEMPTGDKAWKIADNGPGVKKELCRRILKEDETMSGNSDQDFTGHRIGLVNLVKQLSFYETEITCYRNKLGGATFLIYNLTPEAKTYENGKTASEKAPRLMTEKQLPECA